MDDKLDRVFDESSRHNRNVMVAFILFCIYILVSIASTTDKQLLVCDVRIQLPLISVAVPLVGFYILTPIFLFAYHLAVLINLKLHVNKISAWGGSLADTKDLLRFPYIFNFITSTELVRIDKILLKLVASCVYIGFPLAGLLFIQIRFSSYHSLPMTGFHYILFLLDTFLIVLYWPRIINVELQDNDSLMKMVCSNIRWFKMSKYYMFIIAALSLIATANLITIILLITGNIDNNYLKRFKTVIPHLVLVSDEVLISPVSDNIIQRYLALGKDRHDAILDFAQG